MYKVRKILVAVDLSSCSRVALEHALALAAPLGAKVDVLYVAEVPAMKSELEVSTRQGSQPLRSYLVDEARTDLNEFLVGLSSEQRSKLELLVDSGDARERILKRAADGGYDLVVMGTHGRTGRPRSLAGSVTESVVRMAACPVLTVREPD